MAILIRFWWAPVIALALAFAGVQTARLNHAKADLSEARTQVAALNTAKAASEKARKDDQAAALASYEGLQSTCSAGIADAISRGRTIEKILYRPAPAGGGRAVVSAGELRGLLGQAERDGSAPGVSR